MLCKKRIWYGIFKRIANYSTQSESITIGFSFEGVGRENNEHWQHKPIFCSMLHKIFSRFRKTKCTGILVQILMHVKFFFSTILHGKVHTRIGEKTFDVEEVKLVLFALIKFQKIGHYLYFDLNHLEQILYISWICSPQLEIRLVQPNLFFKELITMLWFIRMLDPEKQSTHS